MQKQLQTAIRAAKEAGKIHLKYFRKPGSLIKEKNPRDLLTKADIESEKKIIAIIKKEYPDHSFLCEEIGAINTKSDYKWIIDPVDGTGNFYKGDPDFCPMIALCKNNEIILGVIYFPITKELFTAVKGKGAFKNGKKIKVSSEKDFRKMYANTHMTSKLNDRKINLKIYNKFILKLRNIHVINACIGRLLTDVAEGISDFHFRQKYTFWDYAAGSIIVQEAGGKVTDFKGDKICLNNKNALASNGKNHSELLNYIKRIRM